MGRRLPAVPRGPAAPHVHGRHAADHRHAQAQARPAGGAAYGAIRLLAEFTKSIEQNAPSPSYGEAATCQCAYVRNPPCSYCESLEECETCGEFAPGGEMDEHVETEHADAEIGA